ncbi:hypothetical protein RhiirA5_444081 [Rhizophagus irregularis]|uniref:Uncharacterized protein n=1 Tax=Rhizophagus irregularis TaxID=588596 RepID=A0A2N0NDF4_9GLOM|nr:hypothetical protein RhiirA5_444081 [Rhizophagus irregularis]
MNILQILYEYAEITCKVNLRGDREKYLKDNYKVTTSIGELAEGVFISNFYLTAISFF